ncbi:hypothetical protein Tco_1223476, partial [Tanacetum coccineum]
ILFGTIPTTINNTTPSVIPPSTHIDTALTPTSPDYTPASPDYSPVFDMEFDPSEDPLSDHIPPLLAISPFLSSIDDSSDSDTPDTPPSPTHGTPFTEMTLSAQSTPITSGALCRRVMILSPGQPIPYVRLYRCHLNGPVHMMTVRKRVGPLPTHRLAVRHLIDYSSSDHFASDDSLRDSSPSSSLSSSSETSSDPSSDDLSNSSSDHSLLTPSSGMRPSHHLCSLVPSILCSSVAIFNRPSHDSSSTSPSCKRSRSPAASVPSPESAMNLEVEIDEYIAYADALRVRGVRGLVEVRVDRVTHPVIADDILEPTQEEGVIEAIESVQRGQGHRIIATGQQSVDMMERIREL